MAHTGCVCVRAQNMIQAKRWEHLRRTSRNMQATRVDALKKQLLTAEHDTAVRARYHRR